MENRNRSAIIYLVLAAVIFFGWGFVRDAIWPPPPKQRKPNLEEQHAFVAGGASAAAIDIKAPDLATEERKQQAPDLASALGSTVITTALKEGIPELIAAERRVQAAKQAKPPTLLAMGKGEKPFHIQVLLNTRGGSVQQIILTHFQQADREGLPVKNPDGTPRPLHLIPGVRVPRSYKIGDQKKVEVPELAPGPLLDPEKVEQSSYVMTHYEKENDNQPVDTLANRDWRVVQDDPSSDGESHTIALQTELAAPFYIQITKTYTLRRSDYHVGLSIHLEPWERPAGAKVEPFRYQISGPRGMPIEGEWYTSTYRQAIVGWQGTRTLEDPRQVRHLSGSDPLRSAPNKPIRYTGVILQYFASILALDNFQPDGQQPDYIDYVRVTPEGPTHQGQEFLDDLTSRAVSRPITIGDQGVTHPYVLYQGPVKVRLLKELSGDEAVPEETVDRYRDDLDLRRLTDAPMPNWLGRFANFIFWSDIVIGFTNLIHILLGWLSHIIPNRGICIILITIMVRGLLHPFSRRQMINAKIMQAKQEKLAPEFKRLTELYGDDPMRLHAEKSKVMRAHGINPSAMFGGCLLLLAQMPIFMGLYYALQESVFFRLEPLTPWWIPNLAAPDMLIRWGEDIPWISDPPSLGGALYLGPYLNLLPLVAVSLMMYVQTKMMPKSDDPQVQMQQKTMKFMMIMFAFFFYKVAAGLCIYFICSSVWGMIERKLLPKNIKKKEDTPAVPEPKDREKPQATEPKGWLGKRMAGWKEKWNQILDEAQKQQQLQRDQRSAPPRAGAGPPGAPQGPQGPGRKKKKKR
jgi:YidC/Oxa1 family membrane protein insertase